MDHELKIKKFVAEQLGKGVKLADIQKLLASDMDCQMTFLDLRLLAAELEDVSWTQFDPAQPAAKPEDDAKNAPPAAAPGATKVEVSKLARPGALAHGSVTFASGAGAEWIVDSMGRLGLDKVSGEPTEADYQEFQAELQKIFAR